MKVKTDLLICGYNPRNDIGDVEELKESIRQMGLINPILVRPKDGYYEILGGQRRFKAIQELGWQEVDVIIRDLSDEEAYHIAFIDNYERKQLNPIEEARHFKKMIEEFGYKTKSKDKEKSLADVYKIDQSIIVRKLQLLELPEKIMAQIFQSTKNYGSSHKNEPKIMAQAIILTETHCRYIYQLCNKAEIEKLFDTIYEDFKNEGALNLWERLKKEEYEYRQSLQINLAQEIIDLGLSVKQVESKVSRIKEDLKKRDQEILDKIKDIQAERTLLHNIFFKSCVDMSEIQDETIHLIVTSPPYFSNKEYENMTFTEYEELLSSSLKECYRVLCPGGRLCLNIADIPNKDGEGLYPIALTLFPITQKLGFKAMDKIIWKKDDPWHSNPHIKLDGQSGKYRILPSTEYIYIFEKPGIREVNSVKKLQSNLNKEEWKKYVTGLWDIPSVRVNDKHPSMFPEELPRRLIKMFSFVGDNVLDPFLGSGTTVKVARELGRVGFGYEIMEKYKDVIIAKLSGDSTQISE